ncbi:MAG: hypothetical protein IJD14_06075 [Christensenellaceae bacterium]|nr:hypothetical protein [Christensenellaceae bacterium]
MYQIYDNGGGEMCLKRLIALVLIAIGSVLCLFLLPVKVWLAITGAVLIVLAILVLRSC